ncbi:MAG: carboxypeptidase-like regulatory domain-containing protein [Dysgonamonadaceae bacterium]|jgi:hypothetical protein|nr:carboxypeptidase-like regulatory domain-containing protein [Dysgonamonadaceae bacterium]
MKRFFPLAFLLVLLFQEAFSAQITLSGKIRDSNGNGVPNVNVIIRESATHKILAYTSSNNEGIYSLKISSEMNGREIVFKRLGYSERIIALNSVSFPLNVVLEESNVLLDEVTVTPEIIRVRGDTTEYFLSSFIDGTEKVMEDVLKKLPGIDVDDEGTIKFKGDVIKKIMVDGVDLFDVNYKIASKNVPANFVASVQAIEHYHENRLLKKCGIFGR